LVERGHDFALPDYWRNLAGDITLRENKSDWQTKLGKTRVAAIESGESGMHPLP
jgi:hypothetical protein